MQTAPQKLVRAMRALALACAVGSFATLWLSERTRVLDDLQLASEATARPGETIALRAFYLRDVEAPAGPTLEIAPVVVRLLDAHEREIGRARLRPGRGDRSMEGSVRIPATARGGLILEARAQLAERAPRSCRRGLDVALDAPTLVAREREVSPLQQLALGALRVPHSASAEGARVGATLALSPRVLGGACVPEQRCLLLVWVGGEGALLRLRHDRAIHAELPKPAGETTGFVELSLTVHGPEATLVLEARRGSELVAERTVRLPVALGEARLSVPSSVLEPGQAATLEVTLPPGREQGIVDAFVAGRWSQTQSFVARSRAVVPLSTALLGPGLLRLQAHTDRFAGEGAGTRVVYVRRHGESSQQVLAQIVKQLRAGGVEPAPFVAADGSVADTDVQRSAAFLLAGLEQRRVPLPRAVSGRPVELKRLTRAQAALRFGVGALLTLSALVVGMSLMRRGLAAQNEARAILAEAELEAGSKAPLARSSGLLFVVCLVLAVGLAFLLAALLIVAKPLWF